MLLTHGAPTQRSNSSLDCNRADCINASDGEGAAQGLRGRDERLAAVSGGQYRFPKKLFRRNGYSRIVKLGLLSGGCFHRWNFEPPASALCKRLHIFHRVQIRNESGVAGLVRVHQFGMVFRQMAATQFRAAG